MNSPSPISTQNIRLAVVEDDREFRLKLVEGLAASPGWTVVASCDTAEAALRDVPSQAPDLVLIDIRLPVRRGQQDTSGLNLIRRLKPLIPQSRLVVLSVSDEPNDIFQAIQDGAIAYIVKGGSWEELVEQIEIVLDGGACMSASVARKCFEWFQRTRPLDLTTTFSLTDRHWQILKLTARGRSQSEIAGALGISPNTVRNHLANIYAVLDVRSAAEAVYKVGPALRTRESLQETIPPLSGSGSP